MNIYVCVSVYSSIHRQDLERKQSLIDTEMKNHENLKLQLDSEWKELEDQKINKQKKEVFKTNDNDGDTDTISIQIVDYNQLQKSLDEAGNISEYIVCVFVCKLI